MSAGSSSFRHFEILFSGNLAPTDVWRHVPACLFESTPLACHQTTPSDQAVGCLKTFRPLTTDELLRHIDAWNGRQPTFATVLTVDRLTGVAATDKTWVRHIVDQARQQGPGPAYHRWSHSRLAKQLHIDMVTASAPLAPRRAMPPRGAPSCTALLLPLDPKKKKHARRIKPIKPAAAPPSSANHLQHIARILVSMREGNTKPSAPSTQDKEDRSPELQRMARIIELQAELLRLQQRSCASSSPPPRE